jgi:hypothetical protein
VFGGETPSERNSDFMFVPKRNIDVLTQPEFYRYRHVKKNVCEKEERERKSEREEECEREWLRVCCCVSLASV